MTERKKDDISCDVCLDLMPLVKDQVASEDSKKLVNTHIAQCEMCKMIFESEEMIQEYQMSDQDVLNKIKRRLITIGLLLTLMGGLVGICFSNSAAMFYNTIIMPCVGVLGGLVLTRKYYRLTVSTAILSYIIIMVKSILEDTQWLGRLSELFLMPLLLTIIYTLLVSIGLGIALLFKYALSKVNKGTEPWAKRILAGILGILLSGLLIWEANGLLGNPISAQRATNKAKAYIEETYPYLDLEVAKARYNFKFNTYTVNISSQSSLDTHFYVEYRNGEIVYDGYQSSVEGKWNTIQRLGEICTSKVLKVLEQVPGLKNNTTFVSFEDEKMDSAMIAEDDSIWLDMPYEKSLTNQMRINIRCDLEDTTLENITRVFESTYKILKENDYNFKNYDMFSETNGTLVMISNVKPEDITSGKLLEKLQEASQREESKEGEIRVTLRNGEIGKNSSK